MMGNMRTIPCHLELDCIAVMFTEIQTIRSLHVGQILEESARWPLVIQGVNIYCHLTLAVLFD